MGGKKINPEVRDDAQLTSVLPNEGGTRDGEEHHHAAIEEEQISPLPFTGGLGRSNTEESSTTLSQCQMLSQDFMQSVGHLRMDFFSAANVVRRQIAATNAFITKKVEDKKKGIKLSAMKGGKGTVLGGNKDPRLKSVEFIESVQEEEGKEGGGAKIGVQATVQKPVPITTSSIESIAEDAMPVEDLSKRNPLREWQDSARSRSTSVTVAKRAIDSAMRKGKKGSLIDVNEEEEAEGVDLSAEVIKDMKRKRRLIPLQAGIGAITSLQVLVAVGITWCFLYFRSFEPVNDMRGLYEQQLSSRGKEVVEEYIGKPIRARDFIYTSLFLPSVDIHDPFGGALQSVWMTFKTFPELSVVYIGRERDGKFFGYKRVNSSDTTGLFLGHLDFNDDSNMTRASAEIDEGTPGLPLPSTYYNFQQYDARMRTWYRLTKEAKPKPAGVWTPVYLFAAVQELGITVTAPIFNSTGGLEGVIGIDLTLGAVGTFLDTLQEDVLASAGVAYVEENGTSSSDRYLIGTSEGSSFLRVPDGSGGVTLERRLATNASSEIIRAVATALDEGETIVNGLLQTSVGPMFVVDNTITSDVQGLHWRGYHLLPAEYVFGSIYISNRITVGIVLIVAIMLTVMAFFSMVVVTRPLRLLQNDMTRVAELVFSREVTRSWIREIHEIQSAFLKLKVALRSFARYVPIDVVRTILRRNEDVRLAVRQRRVTIFFSDIAGFTTYAEKLTPKDLVSWLSVYLSVMTELIKSSEGVVGEFIGDAIMAFWNAMESIPTYDHELKACMACLRQVEALEIMKEKWKPLRWPQCEIRCGIHTDDVLCGNIGSPDRLKFGLVGDGVNLASRLEGLCKRYRIGILMSDATYQKVKDDMLCRKVDFVTVKGKDEPTWLYELMAVRSKAREDQLHKAEDFDQLFSKLEEGLFDECVEGCSQFLQVRTFHS
mmetsp:Transcript_34747/g.90108  ORF Transcript_34747/g.90108 Transcript_34747/m.90108 type:complete len:937 (-) Transcript_34747:1044-3854(-)